MKEGLIHGIKFHRDCAIGEELALERRSCVPIHRSERRVWNLLLYISKGSGKIN